MSPGLGQDVSSRLEKGAATFTRELLETKVHVSAENVVDIAPIPIIILSLESETDVCPLD